MGDRLPTLGAGRRALIGLIVVSAMSFGLVAVAALPGAAGVSARAGVAPFGQSPVVAIAAGGAHSCALIAADAVKCWGFNDAGQLGSGNNTSTNVPGAVTGLTAATAIATGTSHTCAIVAGGAGKCWGFNFQGQLGSGNNTSTNVPVSVNGIAGATAIVAGDAHSCALIAAGAIKCWGRNNLGQLGSGNNTDSNVPIAVTGLTGATAIVAGTSHTCALIAAGAIKCWGQNNNGQLGFGNNTDSNVPVAVSGLTAATAIATGNAHTCALIAAGAGKCWGLNGQGQLGSGNNTSTNVPVTVSGLSGASAIAGGNAHTCALIAAGAGECWGTNFQGQLGSGNNTDSNVPVAVSGLSGATEIATGSGHSCGLSGSGVVSCWGFNGDGQLGSGNSTNSNVPVGVVGLGRPDNDNFANAEVLDPSGGVVQFPTTNATVEAGEPAHPGIGGPFASVWYSFTPSTSGTYRFETCSSDYDPIVEVYTGATLNALTSVAISNGTCELNVDLNAATTYRISVDGFAGATGILTMEWFAVPPPTNDNFANAASITGTSGSFFGDTTGATVQSGEPSHGGEPPAHTVWFTHTPSASGTLTLDTCHSGFDTIIAVYTGTTLTGLTPRAANDQGCISNASAVSLAVIAGTVYRIAISGYQGQQGHYTLRWNRTAVGTPGIVAFPALTRGDGWINIAWTPPAFTGTSAITGYTISRINGATTITTTVPAASTRATLTGLSNGTTYDITVTATSAAGNGSPSFAEQATPTAGNTDVVSRYEPSEATRLQMNATLFTGTIQDAQLTSTSIIAFLVGLTPPGITPVEPSPPSGSTVVTTVWPPTEQQALTSVMRRYSLTAPEAQKFSVLLVGFLLALGGH